MPVSFSGPWRNTLKKAANPRNIGSSAKSAKKRKPWSIRRMSIIDEPPPKQGVIRSLYDWMMRNATGR
ncbi:MAG TPA: hypothetical protein VFQ52_06700, partial [Rhizomicrobium sp.]|nr:hypothetical protein [Rhizomicrobium sp.]